MQCFLWLAVFIRHNINQMSIQITEEKKKCRRCRYDKCVSIGIVYDGPMRVRVKTVTPLLERIEKEYK